MNPDHARALIDAAIPGWRDARLVSGNRRVRCVFHDDRSPSMDIHETKLGFICRSCGASGGAVDLARHVLGEDRARGILRDLSAPTRRSSKPKTVVETGSVRKTAEYVFVDRHAEPLFAKWRYRRPDGDKFFSWRMPTAGGGWRKKESGEPYEHVLYELPLVVEADVVLFNEGEKAADRINRELALDGIVGTCMPVFSPRQLRDYVAQLPCAIDDLLIVADNDQAGVKKAVQVARACRMSGCSSRVVLPAIDEPKVDAFDHLEAGFGIADFIEILKVSA